MGIPMIPNGLWGFPMMMEGHSMKVDDITNGVLVLIRLGVAARFIFCMIKLIGADEDAGRYKKRSKNAVLFWIIAESVWAIRDMAYYYYK